MSRHKGPYRPDNPNRPLSIREKKVIAARAKGFSQKKALAIAGYKPGSSGQVLTRPVVQSALTEALRKQGVSRAKIPRPIKDALGATLHSSFMGELRASKLPDHKTRLEAAELGISLYGGLPKQVELPAQPQEPLTIIVESPDGHKVGLKIGGKAAQANIPTPQERQAQELKIVLDGVPHA